MISSRSLIPRRGHPCSPRGCLKQLIGAFVGQGPIGQGRSTVNRVRPLTIPRGGIRGMRGAGSSMRYCISPISPKGRTGTREGGPRCCARTQIVDCFVFRASLRGESPYDPSRGHHGRALDAGFVFHKSLGSTSPGRKGRGCR